MLINKLNKPRNSTQYLIHGAETFRLSSRKILSSKLDTPYNNFGGNFQNLDQPLKRIYKADEGYTFLKADQAGAEALIVAHLCRSGKYRSLFTYGIKPHVYMALKLFPSVWSKHVGAENIAKALVTPISELKKLPFWKQLEKAIKESDNNPPNERYYYFAKKVVHASSYGMKANTFRMALLKESGGTIVISLKDAEEYLNTFHREFPEIQLWHFEVYNTVTKNKQLRNLFGFPYNITNYINQHDYKDLIAWIPQSTVACITRQAYVRLQEYIESNNKNWHLLNDEHDSYMQEVPDNDTEEGARIMKSLIEIELESPVDKTKFRMKSEVQYGKVWAHESETNKDGLKEFAL